MHVNTGVAIVGANPVETVLVSLDSVNEVLACDDRVGSLVLTWVRVDVNVRGGHIAHSHVVRVLALFALLADTSLEVGTQGCLVIDFASVVGGDLGHLLEQGLK